MAEQTHTQTLAVISLFSNSLRKNPCGTSAQTTTMATNDDAVGLTDEFL
jgi:hypothetical protein